MRDRQLPSSWSQCASIRCDSNEPRRSADFLVCGLGGLSSPPDSRVHSARSRFGEFSQLGCPLSPYPLLARSSRGEGEDHVLFHRKAWLPRPMTNPPSRRGYGVAGERGEGSPF